MKNVRDNKEFLSLILIDLSKPFDTVNHDILISKLEKYSIRGSSLKLIKNYFDESKTICAINNTPSKKQNISCGVPQGSVLRPLLFSFCINDLPKASNLETQLFADDTACS